MGMLGYDFLFVVGIMIDQVSLKFRMRQRRTAV